MEDLEDIKLRMAQIKLQTLQNEFSRSQASYLQDVQQLKKQLTAKTQKQQNLMQQLTTLKQQYQKHDQEVKQALQKINKYSPSPKHALDNTIDRTINSSSGNYPKRLYQPLNKISSQPLLVMECSPDKVGKEKNKGQSRLMQKPYKERIRQIDEKVKTFEKGTFRRKFQLLKKQSNTSIPSQEKSKNKIRTSYDLQIGRNNKSPTSIQSIQLRKSEKMIRNPEKPLFKKY